MYDGWVLKICSTGSYQVGKTSLIRRYAENIFETNYIPTIGVDITTKRITLESGQVIKLILMDTAGQEVFGKLRRTYYDGCVGCLIVYDITKRETFESLNHWIEDFRSVKSETDVPISIIGNKIDLEDERVVSTQEGKDFANEHNVSFYECSAKLGGELIPQIYVNLVREYLVSIGESVK